MGIYKIMFTVFFWIHFTGAFSQLTPASVLSEYIKFKSISGNEKPAGEYMKGLCEQFGFYVTVFSDTDSSYNFCASLRPLNEMFPSVLLINHLDVVPVDEQADWKHEPFSGKIANDTIYGRGALDTKGLAVMQVFALKKLKERLANMYVKHNVIVLFVSGEETGGKNGGAKMITPEILSKLNPVVVFGEGGGGLKEVIPGKEDELCFFISNAEKRSIWLKLEATVKANGHGSVPSSKSANKILLKAIEKIENNKEKISIDESAEQTFEAIGKIMGGYKGFLVKNMNLWIFKPLRKKIINQSDAFKILVTNSYQLTQIQNPQGGAVNQVSQTATAYYDCRLLPHKSEKPVLLKLLFRIVDPRIKITIVDESPETEPTKLDAHYDNLKCAVKYVFPSANIIPVLLPATTDNSYFRSVGIPSYGVLPLHLSRAMLESIHANNEKIPVKALEQGINVYDELLRQYVKE